jgi:DNA-binding transcriptional LysR family regulator
MQLDLNLLTALDALLEEGSVQGAAHRLRLSSPAMSRTLGRIRRATGDQILVRTGREMTATPYAVRVRADVHRLVQEAQALLAPEHELDLSTMDRTFTLRFHDGITTAIGPELLAAVHRDAPNVRLRFQPESSVDTNELRYGQVDLECGSTGPTVPEVAGETVAHDRLMVALRADHPRKRFTLRQYAEEDHVIVSRRGRLWDPVDDALAAQSLRRRTVASVQTLTTGLRFAQVNGALVTVPERVSTPFLAEYELRLVPLPLETPLLPVVLTWHQRYEGDRGHRWLRSKVRAALEVAFK